MVEKMVTSTPVATNNEAYDKKLDVIVVTTFICWLCSLMYLMALGSGFWGIDLFILSVSIFTFLVPITIIKKVEEGSEVRIQLNGGKLDKITLFFAYFGILIIFLSIFIEIIIFEVF